MRGVLARSALEGRTIVETWEDLSKQLDMPEWRAERIVRTEQSFAANRRQILDAIDTYGDDAEEIFAKQLVATFDNRTGEDSVRVHEQVRRLIEPFNDGKRDYQHPPNRPNDREVVVLVPLDEVEGELGPPDGAQKEDDGVAPTGDSGPILSVSQEGGGLAEWAGRTFDPSKAGGPVVQLDWKSAKIEAERLADVESHLRRFGTRSRPMGVAEAFMLQRLQRISAGEIRETEYDLKFYTHELRELERYRALGWSTGQPSSQDEAHELWNNVHTATLADFQIRDDELFHPDTPR